jgi:2-keto-4-pentenoate hydratase/2-oxohepta-3-ene-1,7-dioic acid hydratase in catechol pathway
MICIHRIISLVKAGDVVRIEIDGVGAIENRFG